MTVVVLQSLHSNDCQDPFTLKSGNYLRELFPNSKFLFMVRDGRATVHSIISRKVTITGRV